jgi:hypothetical protein
MDAHTISVAIETCIIVGIVIYTNHNIDNYFAAALHHTELVGKTIDFAIDNNDDFVVFCKNRTKNKIRNSKFF